jgi:uncharacterized protein (DUF58 family)
VRARSLLRTITGGRVGGGGRVVVRPVVTAGAGQGLLPGDATLGRLRRFSLNHGLRPVDGLVGEHRSRRRGAAPEFSDFAPYTPGDDMRRIDWNAYARFESLYVRESEVTTELDVHLLVDASASMAWRAAEGSESKLRLAQRTGALLTWIALARADRLSITAVGGRQPETFGPVQGRGMVVPAATHLAGIDGGGDAPLLDAVTAYAQARPRSGILIVLSDLIGVEREALDHALAGLANQRWRVVILHLEDPLEADPAALAAAHEVIEIEDPETRQRQRINLQPDTVGRYVRGRDAWLADLAATATRRSVPFVRLATGIRTDPDMLLRLERAGVIVA